MREVPIYSAPVLNNDLLLIGLHQGDIVLQTIEPASGESGWAFTLEDGAQATVSTNQNQADAEQASEEPLSFTQLLVRQLPFIAAMTLLTLMLFRRRSAEK